MTTTKQSQICDALTKLGYKETKYNTAKYRVFERKERGTFYFVGKAGSLRYGKTISDSFSSSKETIRTIILKASKVVAK